MRCAVAVAPVRSEARDEAEQVTQLLRDEPVEVEERRDGWVRIVTVYGYPGWVRGSALDDGEGALPEPAAAAPLDAARGLLGAPYEWGGLSIAGIDCSGLVHLSYRATGRIVPRDAWQQRAAGDPVPPGSEEPGDLLVYGPREKPDHVAFWVSPGRILHATGRDDRGVVEEPEPPELLARRLDVVRL